MGKGREGRREGGREGGGKERGREGGREGGRDCVEQQANLRHCMRVNSHGNFAQRHTKFIPLAKDHFQSKQAQWTEATHWQTQYHTAPVITFSDIPAQFPLSTWATYNEQQVHLEESTARVARLQLLSRLEGC